MTIPADFKGDGRKMAETLHRLDDAAPDVERGRPLRGTGPRRKVATPTGSVLNSRSRFGTGAATNGSWSVSPKSRAHAVDGPRQDPWSKSTLSSLATL